MHELQDVAQWRVCVHIAMARKYSWVSIPHGESDMCRRVCVHMYNHHVPLCPTVMCDHVHVSLHSDVVCVCAYLAALE